MISTKETIPDACLHLIEVLDYGSSDPEDLRAAARRVKEARINAGYAITELPSNDQIDVLMSILGAKQDDEQYTVPRDAIRSLILNLRTKQPNYDMDIPDMAKLMLSFQAYMNIINACPVTPHENKGIVEAVLRDFMMFTSHQMSMAYKERLDKHE